MCWSRTGSFDPVHGSRIHFGKDDVGFYLGICGTVPKSSELMFGLIPSVVEGAAAGDLPGRKVGSKVSEIRDDFDAAVDLFPEGIFEPSSNLIGASEFVAFARCYLL